MADQERLGRGSFLGERRKEILLSRTTEKWVKKEWRRQVNPEPLSRSGHCLSVCFWLSSFTTWTVTSFLPFSQHIVLYNHSREEGHWRKGNDSCKRSSRKKRAPKKGSGSFGNIFLQVSSFFDTFITSESEILSSWLERWFSWDIRYTILRWYERVFQNSRKHLSAPVAISESELDNWSSLMLVSPWTFVLWTLITIRKLKFFNYFPLSMQLISRTNVEFSSQFQNSCNISIIITDASLHSR